MEKIFIIMPVRNGSSFIGQLLDSLIAQTERNWHLIIRDDGSTDDTTECINNVSDPRIEVLAGNEHLGVCKSIDILLGVALERQADLIFFCDCDDVWRYDKIQKMRSEMVRISDSRDQAGAQLLFTELRVIGEQNQDLGNSLLRYAGWTRREGQDAAEALLGGNFVTGCSVALNRQAAELVHPIPDSAGLHDGWSALLASWAGGLHFMEESLVDYRIHSQNAVGVTRPTRKILRFLRGFPSTWSRRIAITEMRFRRAKAGRDRLVERSAIHYPSPRLDQFLALPKVPAWRRPFEFLKLGLQWHSLLGKLVFTLTLPWISSGCLDEE